MVKDVLRSIRYFTSFDDIKLEELAKICTLKRLSAGEILFYEGEEPKHIYYLRKGFLKILKNQGALKQVYIHTMGPGMMVAEVTMFEQMNYPATTEAMEECEVLAIDRSEFIRIFFNDVSLLQAMIKSLSMKVKYLMNSLERETSLGTDLKIAKFIINHEKTISSIKHKNIALELNTTSETISRILKKFKKNGFLATTNPITIQDLKGLKILCN
ncbi:MAG: Crp/Fnr family transcriptional regulator [Epsilonproteobacteria bacterium]|nr:Crp/Fnr family transcriptional regulator [Campylobacterota bacterium]